MRQKRWGLGRSSAVGLAVGAGPAKAWCPQLGSGPRRSTVVLRLFLYVSPVRSITVLELGAPNRGRACRACRAQKRLCSENCTAYCAVITKNVRTIDFQISCKQLGSGSGLVPRDGRPDPRRPKGGAHPSHRVPCWNWARQTGAVPAVLDPKKAVLGELHCAVNPQNVE